MDERAGLVMARWFWDVEDAAGSFLEFVILQPRCCGVSVSSLGRLGLSPVTLNGGEERDVGGTEQ